MKTNDNNRIFDKQTKTWFEVTPEEYKRYDQWRTNLRKREQYHGRCMCPRQKWWLCDGMCEDCEFHAPGDMLSLDATETDAEGGEFSLLDCFASPESVLNEIILDQVLMKQLLKRLEELMPEAIEIGKLRQEGLSDEAIADIIGIKRTTFLSRLKEVKSILREEYGEDFDF